MLANMRSIGLRSDAFVMTGLSTIEDQGTYWIMRTPHEPDYWYGNLVIHKDVPTDPIADLAVFAQHFPDAKHVQVSWDVPGLSIDPVFEALTPFGYTVETYDVLALPGDIRRVNSPEGVVCRAIKTVADWNALLALQVIGAIEEGHDPAHFTPFAQNRNNARQQQIGSGLGAWFGAFVGDKMVAHMGMFVSNGVARYQTVETLGAYRHRGIASSLLVHAYDWAMKRDPAAQAVIVADADSDGGRLYRHMGFDVAEIMVEAFRHPNV